MSINLVNVNGTTGEVTLDPLAGVPLETLENIEDNIASPSTKEPLDATTATKAHSEGDCFYLGDVFVKAIDDIDIGDTLVENTNYKTTTVGDELTDAVSNLGTASGKDYITSVTSGNEDLVTSGAVYTYVDTMITQALSASY